MQINTMFRITDNISAVTNKITKNMNKMNSSVSKASGNVDKMNTKLDKVKGASSGVDKTAKEVRKIGDNAKTASSKTDSLGKSLKILASSYALIKSASAAANISDDYISTNARLGMINDGLQTQAELQKKILASANATRGSYYDMADAVSKLSLNAPDLFASNDEAIAFTELLQKGMVASGTSSTEQSSVMTQLTQALGSGKLQGDEFRSISENFPMLLNAVMKYTGKSRAEIKQMSTDGELSAQLIKNAMFSYSDEITDKFNQMPQTFSGVWTKIKNNALYAFDSVINKINELINTEKFNNFVNAVSQGLSIVANVISNIIDFIVSNWSTIQTILVSVVLYLSAIAVCWTVMFVLANITTIAIIALIAGILGMLRAFGVSWETIFNVIGTIVGTVIVYIANYFIYLWNVIINFVNFLAHCFQDPISAIQVLFYNMASNVIGFIKSIASAIETLINKIPGVEIDITSSLSKFKNELGAKAQSVKDEAGLKDVVKTMDYLDSASFINKASSIGTSLSNLGSSGDELALSAINTSSIANNALSGVNTGTASNPTTVTGTGKNGAVDVSMEDEDLKYLRDIADRDYINKVNAQTLSPNLVVNVTKPLDSKQGEKELGDTISRILSEQIAIASEG